MILLIAAVSVASARGDTPAHLGEMGWTCENVPGLGVRCFRPSFEFPPSPDNLPATIQVKVFHTDDPTSDDADFLGTEILVCYDIYERGGEHDAPCPQEHAEHYLDLRPENGLPYYACHHYSHDH